MPGSRNSPLGRLLGRPVAEAEGDAVGRRRGEQAMLLVREFEEQGSGWFWQTDADGFIIYLSSKVADRLLGPGVSPAGRLLVDLFCSEIADGSNSRTLAFQLSSRTAFSDLSVQSVAQADGQPSQLWSMSGRPTYDALGHLTGFVGTGSDLTEKRRADAEIARLALTDALTGLANRQRIRSALEQTLAQTRGTYRATSLLLLDLDRFKMVNDTLGHQAGDTLLQQVAARLLRCIDQEGVVGRLGGDEFQIVLTGRQDRDELAKLATDIIRSLSQPYSIGGSSVSIGCSVGIALAPADGDDAETLIRNADLALYAAKANGRGTHRFYKPDMLAGAQGRKQMEDDLRNALVRHELYLVYQPVVRSDDHQIVGYEALVRWAHPRRGEVSPAEFIPIAEDSGLIEPLGEWVLRTATQDAANWLPGLRVAVNVSPIQFANPALPSLVTSAIARSGLTPDQLELEITESVFLNDEAASARMFKQLKGIGVRLALDDFGTGYSSLGYLRNAPFDKIKIDQSFVRGAATPGNRNAAIVQAIVTLAQTLGMDTTAEGVELQAEIELIERLGCSHIQGYAFGRPVRQEIVLEQLAAGGGAGSIVAAANQVAREARARTLRWARLRIGDAEGDVRIRNLSASGAMIDGIKFDNGAAGTEVLIELTEGRMVAATIRWTHEGQAGLAFDQRYELETLLAPPRRPSGVRATG